MSDPYAIRKATGGDYAFLVASYQAILTEGNSAGYDYPVSREGAPSVIARTLENGGACFSAIAELPSGEKIGFVLAAPSYDLAIKEPLGMIEGIGVHPSYRRRGIALNLLRFSLMEFHDASICRIEVSAAHRNRGSVALFMAAGFNLAAVTFMHKV